MNSISLAARSSALVVCAVPLVFLAACGSAPPPVAKAAPMPAVANATPSSTSAPTIQPSRGTVAISDEIRTACGIPSEDAFFAFDSATLESSDVQPLNAVARCFSTGPLAGRHMRLVGHADPRGTSEYNMTLGQARADSVEGYIDRRGVQRSQVETTSRGALDATGLDESGWTHDRRVDVLLGG